MPSLLQISDLTENDLVHILDTANAIAKGQLPKFDPTLTVATLFYENSTRTKVSFELAAKRLGLVYTDIDLAKSSETKGETCIDTLLTLTAMNIDAFVIRHKTEGLMRQALNELDQTQIINAGEGMKAHPSQALLDLFTIQQKVNANPDLQITIVGDIKHSRVTASLITGLQLWGVKDIVLCAPNYFLPAQAYPGVVVEYQLDKAIADSDVIYALRVQKERFEANDTVPLSDYTKQYCITADKIKGLSKQPKIMHPGPINRGIEISSEVADGPQSLILNQVENGVYTRMAIYHWVLSRR